MRMSAVMVIGACFLDAAGTAARKASARSAGPPASIELTEWQFFFAGNDTGFIDIGSRAPSDLESVRVPHVFPRKGPEGPPVSGAGWYVRDVALPASCGDRELSLDFEGVCLRARVYVDGIRAGGCDFAYVPFAVDLTDFVRGKTHFRLAVMIDNRPMDRQIPDKRARGWWMHGGMIRETRLRFLSVNRIGDASIRTFYRASDAFDLRVSLTAPAERWDSVRIAVANPDRASTVLAATLRGTDSTFHIEGIRPWSPESPYRYTISLVPFFKGEEGDTMTIRRGFCQMYVSDGRLYLNGTLCHLRGMARHDIIGYEERPPTREERLHDLLELKSLGVNFLRIAHFPQHRDVYELCDSLGLLVMDEIPAWKTDPAFIGSEEGRAFGIGYMDRLIRVHGSFTSVCMWSLGNQFRSFKSAVADFVRAVGGFVRKADPSRPVTFCSCYYTWDKAFSYVDVISVNEYFGWELATLNLLPKMLEMIHKDWPEKPILVSELGAQAQLGLANPLPKLAGAVKSLLTKDLSEDHQALFIGAHLDTIWSRRDIVCGSVIWAFADYRSYLKKARTAVMPAGLNACGIVTSDRKRKRSYDIVKQRYALYGDLAQAQR